MEALDLISGISSSNAAAITLGGKTKGTGSGFDALLAALTNQSQQTLSQTAANTSETGKASASDSTQSIQINSPADTPVARLETALRQSGQPLEKITVPPEAREKMVEVLENSGYSTEDAQEILRRATDDEGNINLGAMFELLPRYTADQGPVLVLDQDAKIQLMQALNDLGVPAGEIRRFFESAEHIGQKIELKGITDLLAMADPNRSEVDRSVLEDLLGKLGLNAQEVENLLDSKVDSQGRISPSDMLSLLETAAEKNDTKIATALKTLANQIEVQGDDTKEIVRQLRTMVSQALEQAPKKSAETQQTLQQTAQPQTLQTESAQTEGTQSAAATNEQSSGSATQSATQSSATAAGEALAAETQTDTAKSAADILGKLGQETVASARQNATTSETGSQTGFQGGKSGDQTLNQGLAQQAAVNAKAATSTATQDSGSSKFNDALTAAQNSAARGAAGQGSSTVNRGIPAYVTRQVSQQMASMVRSGAPSLTLNLKPAHLGSLNMEVTMKDGNLQATLTADNAAAKQTLEAGLDLLREQLMQQGIKVDRIEVAVNADANPQQQQTAQTSGQSGNGRSGNSGSGESGAEDGQVAASQTEEQSTTQTTARSRISIIA